MVQDKATAMAQVKILLIKHRSPQKICAYCEYHCGYCSFKFKKHQPLKQASEICGRVKDKVTWHPDDVDKTQSFRYSVIARGTSLRIEAGEAPIASAVAWLRLLHHEILPISLLPENKVKQTQIAGNRGHPALPRSGRNKRNTSFSKINLRDTPSRFWKQNLNRFSETFVLKNASTLVSETLFRPLTLTDQNNCTNASRQSQLSYFWKIKTEKK